MTQTARIFLSYAHEDEERVSVISKKLAREGHRPWRAQRDLYPGEDWKPAIQRAIRGSDLFLACLTKNSIDRGYTNTEIKEALAVRDEMPSGQIYLIPLRLEECEIPDPLREEIHYLDYFREYGWDRLKQTITEALERRKRFLAPREVPIYTQARTFKNTNRLRLAHDLASFLNEDRGSVRVTSITRGIVRITIEVPSPAEGTLVAAYNREDPRLLECFVKTGPSSRIRVPKGG